MGVSFAADAQNLVVGFATGTGYITDAAGNPLCGVRSLASVAYYGPHDAGFQVGLFPFQIDENGTVDPSLSTPLTFYGAHFQHHFARFALLCNQCQRGIFRATDSRRERLSHWPARPR